MCNPVALQAGIAVVSTVFTANQQRAEGRYRQGVSEYNARVSENEAQRTRTVGVEEENAHRQQVAMLISKQKAQQGASGIDVNTGAPLTLRDDTAVLGEADALRIRGNYEDRATALETGAALEQDAGAFARSAGNSNAFGTLLSGAGKVMDTGVADKWFTPESAGNRRLNLKIN
ncbi:MAG: hypothetical protein GY949_02555 [Gammaproteobacteria bacterium]|nr:hypothetical protein [Gammaproteobacteria bacterium]